MSGSSACSLSKQWTVSLFFLRHENGVKDAYNHRVSYYTKEALIDFTGWYTNSNISDIKFSEHIVTISIGNALNHVSYIMLARVLVVHFKAT